MCLGMGLGMVNGLLLHAQQIYPPPSLLDVRA
jgi:hypothetical protein